MRIGVGTMTGTSMDGVDAVAVRFDGHALEMRAEYLSMASREMGALRQTLQGLYIQHETTQAFNDAALELGDITKNVIQELHLSHIDFIALHGQTIFHKPPKSIQLINPEPITQTFDCDVFTDPRAQDLQHGGQGAPITPLADWVMFRNVKTSTAIVNLGGFCNVTLLPANSTPKEVEGFDVCSCNLLLNTIAQHRLNMPFDEDGVHATQGKTDAEVSAKLLHALFEQRTAHRSLGTDDELGEFALQIGSHLTTCDLLATVCSAIGDCINDSICDIDRIYLAGGGVHNNALRQVIRNNGTTETLGVPTQAREGMAMAILGALAQDGVSITLPQITGRSEIDGVVGWTQVSP